MEGSTADTRSQLEIMLQDHGSLGTGTDHHHFGGAQADQLFLKPFNPGIVRQPLLLGHQLLRGQPLNT